MMMCPGGGASYWFYLTCYCLGVGKVGEGCVCVCVYTHTLVQDNISNLPAPSITPLVTHKRTILVVFFFNPSVGSVLN